VRDVVREERSTGRATAFDEELLWGLVEAVPDGIVIADSTGTVVLVNRRLEQLFGYARDELIGGTVDRLLPERFRASHAVHRRNYTANPHTRAMGEQLDLRGRRADGTEFPVEVALSPLSSPNGALTIATVRDISDRLAAQSELQSVRERAVLAEDHERIARDLHDTVIQRLFASGLTLQAVATRLPDDVRSRLLDIIDDHDRIIREIRTAIFGLTATRAVTGEVRAAVLEVVDEAARPLGFRPSVRLDGVLDGAVDDEVANHLVAVLREALSNTARHSHATRVDVDVRHDAGVLTLVVSDNGVGIGHGGPAGSGLRNMNERAVGLGGVCSVTPAVTGGTVVTWTVPARAA
jgi:PAS domain S-box-containing protein